MVWAFAEEGWQIYWTKAVEDEVARQEVLVVSNLVVLWQRARALKITDGLICQK